MANNKVELLPRVTVENTGFTINSVQIGDLNTRQMNTVFNNLISVSVDYTIDESSQLTIELIDPDFEMANANYFVIGKDVLWQSSTYTPWYFNYADRMKLQLRYEIASVDVAQGPGASPKITLEARAKGIQQMKRDRNPGAIPSDGSTFIRDAATKYGLKYIGQNTDKKKTINKASGSNQADSVWDVMLSLAQEAEFSIFEIDGIIIFASEKYLLGKWGTHQDGLGVIIDPITGRTYPNTLIRGSRIKDDKIKFIPMSWPSPNTDAFQVIRCPQIRKSDQDPYEGTGSMLVERQNGTQLRPGMTIRISNHPFGGDYLITRVSYRENSPEPVSVEFRTPVKQEEDIKNQKDIQIGRIVPAVAELYNKTKTIQDLEEAQRFEGLPPERIKAIEQHILSQQLPSQSNPLVYPTPLLNGTIPTPVSYGNINLWDRPVYWYLNAENKPQTDTLRPYIYNDGTDYVILCRVWCDGNNVDLLTQGEAETKYGNDGAHLGKFNTLAEATAYAVALKKHQAQTLKKRFPKNWDRIIDGKIGRSIGC